MNSGIFEKFRFYMLGITFFVLAMMPAPRLHAQLTCGLQTAKFTSYLGDVTRPGYGGYLGFKVQSRERFALNYQASFLRVPGKYESFPLDNGIETGFLNEVDLVYQNDLRLNLTNFSLDAVLTFFRKERLSFDSDFGLGIGIFTFRGTQTKPYQNYESSSTADRDVSLNFALGIGSEYLWTDGIALRAQLSMLFSAQQYYDGPVSKFGFSIGIVRNLDY
ncbi:MAG: hypothetical protein ACKVOK_03935 [Flavobacteriales bacterium]